MKNISHIRCCLEKGILGRPLNARYYGNVIHKINPRTDNSVFWGIGNDAVIEAVSLNQRIPTLAFTGTQDVSNEGFRITHLMAQVTSALGICTIAGNAYGVDMAMMLGTISRGEFSSVIGKERNTHIPIRQIVALSSSIQMRVPRFPYIEKGVLDDNGLYLAFLNDSAPLRMKLLSARAGLIVDLADALVITEAGNRGALDTVNRAIEVQKPILVVDWADKDMSPLRIGCKILRDLASPQPDCRRLSEYLTPYFEYQTYVYDFSCAHPYDKHDEVSSDGSANRRNYRNPWELTEHLLNLIAEYQSREGVPMIRFVDVEEAMFSDQEDIGQREKKATIVARHIQELLNWEKAGPI